MNLLGSTCCDAFQINSIEINIHGEGLISCEGWNKLNIVKWIISEKITLSRTVGFTCTRHLMYSLIYSRYVLAPRDNVHKHWNEYYCPFLNIYTYIYILGCTRYMIHLKLIWIWVKTKNTFIQSKICPFKAVNVEVISR